MTHVFISYAHEDKDFAQELIQKMKQAGFDHWIDREQIPVGQNWVNEIQAAIDGSYALILIKSSASMKSENVEPEWAYAMGRGVPVIPLLHEALETIHPWLQANLINHLDFRNPTSKEWDELFHILDEKRNEFGIKVRVPSGVSPQIAEGLRKLNSVSEEDVMAGARILAKLKDPIAIPGLVITLGRNDENISRVVLNSLVEIGEAGVPQLKEEFFKEDLTENQLLNIGMALALIKSNTALLTLSQGTRDSRDSIRYAVAHAIKQTQCIEALEQLVELVRDQNPKVRLEAVYALDNLSIPMCIPPLLEALQDTERDIRAAAATGLYKPRDIIVVPHLLNALNDPEPSVREAAARALEQIPDDSAVIGLFRLRNDPDGKVRQAALDAVNRIHTPESREAIKNWSS